MNKKWYKNSLVIALSIFLFFPVGLVWMWILSTWKRTTKLAISGIFVLFFIIAAIFGEPTTTETTADTPIQQPIAEETKELTPTPTPKPIENVRVEVSSQIVKKVSKKYRYFFDIRNNDTKNFEGEVTITLHNDKQSSPLGKDTFTTNKPLEAGLGNTAFIDINSGPISQHGEYGITKFKYVVKVGGNEVNSGEGVISEKFENLDF